MVVVAEEEDSMTATDRENIRMSRKLQVVEDEEENDDNRLVDMQLEERKAECVVVAAVALALALYLALAAALGKSWHTLEK